MEAVRGSVEGDGQFVRNRIYLHRSGGLLERGNVVYLTREGLRIAR